MTRKSKSIIKAFTVCAMASTLAIPASAKTFENGIHRGFCFNGIGIYVKSRFNWQTNYKSEIVDSSGYQVAGGIFLNKGGTYRRYKNPMEHGWAAITEFNPGLSIKGVNLNLVISFEDHVALTNAGDISVKWNVK